MTSSNLGKARVSWIDTLRTISIFSVVIIHTGRVPEAFALYTSSFYMPVFFFISGLFVKESIKSQPFIDYLKTRAQRLLIPYLTFGIVSYILWIFLIGKLKGDDLPANPLLHFFANTIYGVGGYGWLEHNITLWFFPCLLVVELLFFFVIQISSRRLLIATLLALSVVGYSYFYIFDIASFRLPFGIDIALTAVVFYGLGYLVQPYILDPSAKAWYAPPATALGAVSYIVFSNLNKGSAFVVGGFGENYFYFYLAALSGIFFWMQIARMIKPNQLFEQIGQNTLVIFPLHPLLFPFFTGVLVYIFRIPADKLDGFQILGVFYAIAAISILIPVAWGLNRYAPFLLGKQFKIKKGQPSR